MNFIVYLFLFQLRDKRKWTIVGEIDGFSKDIFSGEQEERSDFKDEVKNGKALFLEIN